MSTPKFSPESLPDLTGKVYLVTGGNAGIGKATVAGLASHGARVYMGARSEARTLSSIQDIKKEFPEADIHFLEIDLSRLASVVHAARALRGKETSLHGLINNAGIMAVPYSVTEDNFEIQFQTNYLAHWLLTHHLLPLMRATAGAGQPGDVRLVNVTSDGHAFFENKAGIDLEDPGLESESSSKRYGQSKLANILHVKQLNSQFGPSKQGGNTQEIWFAAVHPGHIDTDLNKKATGMAPAGVLRVMTPIMRCLGILDEQAKGAWSSLWAIASPEFARESSGGYVVPYAKIGTPSRFARDEQLAEKLWSWTEEQLAKRRLL